MSIQESAAEIMQLKVTEVADNPKVRQQFISIYGSLWDEAEAEAVYKREAIHFNRLIRDNDKLQLCTPLSAFIAFIDLAVNGLTLEPGVRALCYLQPRKFKVGEKQARDGKTYPEYEARINLTISGYGELFMRARAGQIRHADNPVVVYEGDEFSFTDKGGVKTVSYSLNMSHNATHPIACYLPITRADGTRDYGIILESDWGRLAGYSGKANKYFDTKTNRYVERPNELYTSGANNTIDTGFLRAKCIKHAFSSYPKLRVGRGTSFEADMQPEQEDFYGGIADAGNSQPAQREESFAPAPDYSDGVTVDPSASYDNDETF